MVIKAIVLTTCWSRRAGFFEGLFLKEIFTRKLESSTVIFNNAFVVVHIHNTLFPAGSKMRKFSHLLIHLKSVCTDT